MSPEFLNGIDQVVLSFLGRYVLRESSPAWAPALGKAILVYSDQQLITGTAILVRAFTQLRCGISAYHWQIVVYLAWFSSLTHSTPLEAPRQYSRDRPLLRSWRASFMLFVVVRLMIALLPVGDAWWLHREAPYAALTSGGSAALCQYRRLMPEGPKALIFMQTGLTRLHRCLYR